MPPGSLRAEPAFVRWATAEGVSMVGSAITTVVLPLVVFEATGSVTQTGALFAVRVVPYLLFGVIAGPVADRGNRRLLIIGGNVAEGLLIATIPLAQAFGVLTVAQVYIVGLLSATAFVFSDAAVFGAVPALVGPERLSAANGFLYALASGAEIAGPVTGGVLAAAIGPANAVWVDAASFLVAAGLQATIRTTFRTGPLPTGPAPSLRAQVARSLRFVRGHHTVATLIGVGFGNSFAFGAVLGLLVPYAVTELGLAGKDARIGLLYGATGLGALLAGVVFGRLFSTERVRWLTPFTLFVSAGVAVGFGNSFAFGAVLGLLVPYAVTELGLAGKDARIGLLYGATGLGALLAGVVFGRLFSTERVRWLTPFTLFVSAGVAVGLAVASLWVAAAILLVAFSWSIATTINVGITYRQLAAPDDLRSSVNVLGRMIAWGGQPFGAACGAFVAGAASVSVAYAGAAVVMAISAAVATVLLQRGGATGIAIALAMEEPA